MQLTLSQLGRVCKIIRSLNDLYEATQSSPRGIDVQMKFEEQNDLLLRFDFIKDTGSFALTSITEIVDEAPDEVSFEGTFADFLQNLIAQGVQVIDLDPFGVGSDATDEQEPDNNPEEN